MSINAMKSFIKLFVLLQFFAALTAAQNNSATISNLDRNGYLYTDNLIDGVFREYKKLFFDMDQDLQNNRNNYVEQAEIALIYKTSTEKVINAVFTRLRIWESYSEKHGSCIRQYRNDIIVTVGNLTKITTYITNAKNRINSYSDIFYSPEIQKRNLQSYFDYDFLKILNKCNITTPTYFDCIEAAVITGEEKLKYYRDLFTDALQSSKCSANNVIKTQHNNCFDVIYYTNNIINIIMNTIETCFSSNGCACNSCHESSPNATISSSAVN